MMETNDYIQLDILMVAIAALVFSQWNENSAR